MNPCVSIEEESCAAGLYGASHDPLTLGSVTLPFPRFGHGNFECFRALICPGRSGIDIEMSRCGISPVPDALQPPSRICWVRDDEYGLCSFGRREVDCIVCGGASVIVRAVCGSQTSITPMDEVVFDVIGVIVGR